MADEQDPELVFADLKKKKKKKSKKSKKNWIYNSLGTNRIGFQINIVEDEEEVVAIEGEESKQVRFSVEDGLDNDTEQQQEETVDDAFANLKKKKKKKVVEPEEEEIQQTPEDEFAAAFSQKKKKKKRPDIAEFEAKQQASQNNDDEEDQELQEEEEEELEIEEDDETGVTFESSDNLIVPGKEPWLTSNRDYSYNELLSRAFNIIREKNPGMQGEKRKFQIIPPQILREGAKKTSFANLIEFCKRMRRQPDHLVQYLFAELGTSGSIDGTQRLIIKGRFQQKQIENILKRYIMEYVTCKTCSSGDTHLAKENRLFFLRCDTCGSSRTVSAIKTGFVAQTAKRSAQRNAAG